MCLAGRTPAVLPICAVKVWSSCLNPDSGLHGP
jgi:hypothetical protein